MKIDWKKITGVCAAVVLATLLSTPAHALTCGQTVTGQVTLTADLICTSSQGLVVQTDNVTIHLNGHIIKCLSPTAYEGSCQIPTSGVALGNAGILVGAPGVPPQGSLRNVSILGPGEITGFAYGIQVVSTVNLLIQNVTISGPAGPFAKDGNGRSFAAGLYLIDIPCFDSDKTLPSAVIQLNDISNQSSGIIMSSVSCSEVKANKIHDNSGAHKSFYSYGIILSGSYNTVSGNRVYHNGDNGYQGNSPTIFLPGWDAGIMINSNQSIHNSVTMNDVSINCGDGIALQSLSFDNVVSSNVMQGNSVSAPSAQCLAVAPGTFFDAAERQAPTNTWQANNICTTKSAGIPANVCQ